MTVLVTGASSGFGRAICHALVGAGYRVLGAARRAERLESLHQELGEQFLPLVMDMADTAAIDAALATLPADFADIDCLVNNAGLALGLEAAPEADFADWQNMIQTNIVGLTYLTRQLLPAMVEKQRGYIINIGSIAGTYPYPGGNVYGATKAYVRQFSLNLRADLAGTGVRVSNIEPGLCGGTEFSNVRFKGDDARAAAVYDQVDYLKAEDIADTVLWLYQRPAHMNVNSIEIMPVAQSFNPLAIWRPSPAERETQAAEPASETKSKGLLARLTGYLKGLD